MWFFKKKNKTEEIIDNKQTIASMAATVEVLISLGQDNEELVTALKAIKDKITYFNPSQKEDVLAVDKKIEAKLGDLKIEISKAKQKGDYSAANELASDIKDGLVVERNAKANIN